MNKKTIIFSAITIIVIGGSLAAYFLIFKKKDKSTKTIGSASKSSSVSIPESEIVQTALENPNLTAADKKAIANYVNTGKGNTKTQSGLSGVKTSQGIFVHKEDETGGVVSGLYDAKDHIKGRG